MPSNNTSKSSAIKAAQQRIKSNISSAGDISQLARDVVDGKRDALARAITLIESNRASDRPLAHDLLMQVRSINNNAQESLRIGVTGIPGVGKSTFIERFGIDLIAKGHQVAVLAVDPSSQRTGGSILGDKTRMENLATNPEAFVRPSPAADALGGVARATMEAIVLCEAAGYDRIVIETVGVGQSETSVRDMVDVFCLLLIGGAGDEVQGIKRGIVEMADLVIVNKADGENIALCKDTASAYRSALHLFPKPEGDNIVDVLTTSSINGEGHNEVHNKVKSLVELWKSNGFFESQRSNQQIDRMENHARALLFENRFAKKGSTDLWNELRDKVKSGHMSAFSAAWEWTTSAE